MYLKHYQCTPLPVVVPVLLPGAVLVQTFGPLGSTSSGVYLKPYQHRLLPATYQYAAAPVLVAALYRCW